MGRARAPAGSCRLMALLINLVLATAAWAAAPPQTFDNLRQASRQSLAATTALPDFAIESASIRLGDRCQPYAPLFYVTATITNNGQAAKGRDGILIYATSLQQQRWGNGVRLYHLGRGASESVTFPIYFPRTRPELMSSANDFMVKIRIPGDLTESDARNNHFGPLSIKTPADFCS